MHCWKTYLKCCNFSKIRGVGIKSLICLCVVFNALSFYFHYNYNLRDYYALPQATPRLAEYMKSAIRDDIISTSVNHNQTPFTRTLIQHEKIYPIKHVNTSRFHSILWYNRPSWTQSPRLSNEDLQNKCEYRNCRITETEGNFREHSAVIFCLTSTLETTPPNKEARDQDQVWIFFGIEAPYNHKLLSFRHYNWLNTMNWSMTYRSDADVFYPYGVLKPRKSPPDRDYVNIFKQKTKVAAWFVSNCWAESGRDQYVKRLRAHGLPVDVFGRCSDGIFQGQSKLLTLINKEYKFYLSFENSLCTDYITEKFFRNYDLNVILVVRGAMSYRKLLPNVTYIDTTDFTSIKSLAQFLLHLSSNETLYIEYLKRKDMFTTADAEPYCEICSKLNNLDKNRRMYPDIVTGLHHESCVKPSDVQIYVSKPDIIYILVVAGHILTIVIVYFMILKPWFVSMYFAMEKK